MRAAIFDANSLFSLKRRLLGSTALVFCAATLVSSVPDTGLAAPIEYNNAGTLDDDVVETQNGIWDNTTEDWTGNSDKSTGPETDNIPFTSGDDVTFGATGVTVEVQEEVAPGSITFIADGYTISALGSNADADISVAANLAIDVAVDDGLGGTDPLGAATISAPFDGDQTITVNGAGGDGILNLSGDSSGATGTLQLEAGTLNNTGTFGGITTINGGTFNANGGTLQGEVTLNGGALAINGGEFSGAGGTGDGSIIGLGGSITFSGSNTNRVIIDADGSTVTVNGGATLFGSVVVRSATATITGDVTGAVRARGGDITTSGNIGGVLVVNDSASTITVNGGSAVGGTSNLDGTLVIAGNFTSDVTNGDAGTTPTTTINNGVTLTGSLSNSAGTSTNNGSVTGTVTVSGGTVANNGSVGGTVSLTGGTFEANALSSVTGLVTNDGGTVDANGGTFTGGILNNSGTLNVNESLNADVTNAGGSVVIDATKVLTGQFANNGGTTTNNGTIVDDLTIAGGTLANNSVITGGVTLTGGELTDDGTASVSGLVTNNGGTVTVTGGTYSSGIVNNSGTVALDTSSSTAVTNQGGLVTIANGTTWTHDYSSTAGQTTNAGTIVGAITLNGSDADAIDDTFTNTATGSVGSVSLNGSAVFNNDGGDVTGTLTLTGGQFIFGGGTVASDFTNAGSDVDINANLTRNVVNNSGSTDIANGVTLTGNATLNGGTFGNAGTLTGTLSVNSGTATNSGDIGGAINVINGTFDGNGGTLSGLTTVSGGTVRADGANFAGGIQADGGAVIVGGNSTGNLTNNGGTVTVNGVGSLTGDLVNISGTVTNNGTLTGDIDVTGGRVDTAGTINGGAGDFVDVQLGGEFGSTGGTINIEVVNNGGIIQADGGTYAGGLRTEGGDTRIRDAVTGDVTANAGFFQISNLGSLTGNVTSGATTIQRGQVSGNVTVTGGTYAAEDIVTGTFTNNGGAVTANGADFQSGATNTASTFAVAGAVTGTLTNTGGTMTIDAPGSVDGNVFITGGSVNNDGIVQGVADLTGGTWRQRSGSDTLGVTRLKAGGTLNANGGDFSGGIVGTGGTLNLNANTTGDIRNEGITITIGAPITLTGDVINNSGTVTNFGTLNGTLDLNGDSAFNEGGADITGLTTVTAGTLNGEGGDFSGGIRAEGGTTLIRSNTTGEITTAGGTVRVLSGATLTGGIIQNSGFTVNRGAISSKIVVNNGVFRNYGAAQGAVNVRNKGTFTHFAAGSIAGETVINRGTFNANGGSFGGDMLIKRGTANINRDTEVNITVERANLYLDDSVTLQGDVLNRLNGTFYLEGTLQGDLDNRGTTFATGTINGDLINTGEFNTDQDSARLSAFTLTGPTTVIAGLLENTGDLNVETANLRVGDLINTGDVTIQNDKVLASDTDATFGAGGSLTIDSGTLAGNISIARNNDVSFNDATIEGNVTTASTISSDGSTIVQSETGGAADLTLTGQAGLTVGSGTFEVVGDLTTGSNSAVSVVAGSTLRANSILSRGTLSTGADATVRASGGTTNSGTATFGRGTQIVGNFRNTGRVNANGRLTFGGNLNGGGRVNLQGNGATGDRVNINGNLNNQRFDLDVDLGGDVGTSDQIIMASDAVVTGNIVLNFNALSDGGRQDADVVVLDVAASDPGNFTFTANGLPDEGDILIYGIRRAGNGDLVVFDSLNPGVAALAGNIVLAQSLIGSVINRPSSPFVSGLAYEDEDPCGPGVWARAVGGQADSRGLITQTGTENLEFQGQIEADYYGFQLGADFACFNGYYNGWDLAFGGIAGVNFGQSVQPVFAIDLESPTGLSDRLTSTTDVEFTQTYGGVYMAAVRDRLAVDLQYRVEQTEFTANNVGASGGPGLGLNDETFRSNASTLSGAVSYAIPVPNMDLTFVPTAGFAYTQVSTDPIVFADRGVVEIDDFDSRTGFVGGTLSRTRFGDDGVSALTQFGTLTVYSDFADSPTSSYTPVDGSGARELESENLGTYGELSAGLNYVRILQPGEYGNAKQFNASIRGDVRLSDRLESWGVTAQARIQF